MVHRSLQINRLPGRFFPTACLFLAIFGFCSGVFAGELGFLEEFALSKDRAETLKKLIPGTEDYYYYTCLYLQGEARLNEVDAVLKQWIGRYKHTPRVKEIENRQALLRYSDAPRESLDFIIRRLNLQFNHQRKVPGREKQLPTRLDQDLISRDTLMREAFRHNSNTVTGFSDSALQWLVQLDLNDQRRRHLLKRLRRPDHPNLPRLVVDDLKVKHSRGFGSHEIHKALLLAQLDECLRLMPDLRNNSNFVNAYLSKLRPGPDVNWRSDAVQREAYLDRLWDFASRLNPAHNSLKVHVLHQRLVHDRALGIYDKNRFMTYIALPRQAAYARKEYIDAPARRNVKANLASDFKAVTLFPPVGNDEPLVRSYLMHFFVKESGMKPYDAYVNDKYLKRCFAEAKIVNGIGDMEQWYSMMTPTEVKQLRDRIDIDFAYDNQNAFGVDEQVALTLFVKNVPSLMVKVFEINTLNYYTDKKREIQADIDLDGLVANWEETHDYGEPPLRRVKRTFKLPAIKGRGVYVVEFIGNGRSSRAVVRKGALHCIERTTAAGHLFMVYDERNRKVADAALHLASHHYRADADGNIIVPFTSSPKQQPILLVHDGFACLDGFVHDAETYRFEAGIYVDREALLRQREAVVMVRPSLLLNGEPVPLSVLTEPALVIQSRDREGVETTQVIKDFKLHGDRESIHTFRVPEGLASIRFTVKAKVENLSRRKTVDLADSAEFKVNGMDKTDKITGIHLILGQEGWTLAVLGKTGEAAAGRAVTVRLQHRDFSREVSAVLKTDAAGRIDLGALKDIVAVKASLQGVEKPQHYLWSLQKDVFNYPDVLHAKAGGTVSIPYLGADDAPKRNAFSLLELADGTFCRDRFDALSLKGGYLQLRGLSAGDYDLLLKDSGVRMTVRMTDGKLKDGYWMSGYRQLEKRHAQMLHIRKVALDEEALLVTLGYADKFTRVHVVGTRYQPEYVVGGFLNNVHFPAPSLGLTYPRETRYMTGRNMGDEFWYIVERKQAKIFPGNMLPRPELLLNPWAIRSTQTGTQKPGGGRPGEYGARFGKGSLKREGGAASRAGGSVGGTVGFVNLDFLGSPSVMLTNLKPDEKGVVRIKLSDLKNRHQLRIVAVNPRDTVAREVCLPPGKMDFLDLRLANGLPPDRHFTEQKKITAAPAGKDFIIDDLRSAEFQAYDSLGRVYGLYMTLRGDAHLGTFGFILSWPELSDADKRARYSEFACHELNFFLWKKDPVFFKEVVLPYLVHKKDKTFLDHWFLGDDLTDYLSPWDFAQLNMVERILLARRIQAEKPTMVRHVKALAELVPPDVAGFNRLFQTAIRGRGLEKDTGLGFEEAKKERTRSRHLAEAKVPSPAAAPKAQWKTPRRGGTTRSSTTALGRLDAKAKAKAEVMEEMIEAEGLFLKDRLKEQNKSTGGFQYGYAANRRSTVRQFYQKLEKTKEWVENNYYKLPLEKQDARLVTVNDFWVDYALHNGKGPFMSTHFAAASRNFTEMMFALAVLDLPFKAEAHKSSVRKDDAYVLRPGSRLFVFHKEIKAAGDVDKQASVMVSQNFYKHGERYAHSGHQKVDKYIQDEFIRQTVYGAHVVVTNPTASAQKLDVLIQIPQGALPVAGGKYTRSVSVALEPYRTWTTDYFFYFPLPGKFKHFPVHVAREEKLAAFARPFVFNVVAEATRLDRTSWDYVSQHGTAEETLTFLATHNLERLSLPKMAWRMHDKAFFNKAIALLAENHRYDGVLWSYGLKHDVLPAAREYLKHCDGFLHACGAAIDSPLAAIDPVARKDYQHREYYPLVNARAHRLGQKRTILNDRFYAQYMALMKILSCRSRLDDDDLMSITYYLLLQDRVADALAFFKRVDPGRLAMRLQYDYLSAYLGFYTGDLARSRTLAAKYAAYPVDRWRKRFVAVTAQVDEIQGKAPAVVDPKDRTQTQTQMAQAEPNFDFEAADGKIQLHYQNLTDCRINYYIMDIELLFSRNPFVKQVAGQFSYIKPNASVTVALPRDKERHVIPLPENCLRRNVMIEIAGSGITKRQAYFANALSIQMSENYGQLKVSHQKTGKALPKVYVKVYARMQNGGVQFYKDGYTDLRGRFDYTSLSTNALDSVDRFALLILSDSAGAVVKEAAPPKR